MTVARAAAFLALAACATPRLDGVSPDAVRPGTTVTLSGASLELADGPVLHGADGSEVELPWTGAGPATRALIVPSDLPSGDWQVGLRSQGWLPPEGTASLSVWRAEDEPPCRRRYRLLVTTETRGRRIVVERQYVDGADPPDEIAISEKDAPGFTVRVRGDEGCAELHLIRPGGAEVLLSDGTPKVMLLQGRAIAEAFGAAFVDARAGLDEAAADPAE